MIDARDRLVEFALERVHAPREDVDLAPQILDAWERGERGSDLADLLVDEARVAVRPAIRPAPRRVFARAGIAAAALIAVTALVVYVARAPQAPAPPVVVARAAAPVRVLRTAAPPAAAPLELATTEIQAGDLVAVAFGDTAEITLATGGRLTARDGAVLAIGSAEPRDARPAARLALHRGSVDLACGPEALEIDARVARLAVLPPCAVLHADVALDPAYGAAKTALAAEIVALASGEGAVPRELRTQVESGSLELARGDLRERLVAGTTRALRAPAREGAVTKDGRLRLEKLLTAVLRGYMQEDAFQISFAVARTPWEREIASELLGFLGKEPQYWSVVEDELEARLARFDLQGHAFRRIVDAALADDSGRGFELGRRLWLLHPEGFRDAQIAVFAERGAFELEREARARVESGIAVEKALPIACAAWVARNGERAGADMLWRFLQEPPGAPTLDDVDRAMLAAFTLDAIDRGDAWSRGVMIAATASETELEKGRLVSGALMALVIQYFDEARAARRAVPLEAMSTDLIDYCQTRLPSLDGAADVRTLLERLRR